MTDRTRKDPKASFDMEKINILFCILYLAHGGTEKQLMTLIKGLNQSIFVPHLCCMRKSMIEPTFGKDALSLFRNIKCRKLQLDFKSFQHLSSIFSILKLSRYIRKNRIDIVVSYFIDPTITGFFSSKLSLCKPLMVTCFRDLGLLRSSQHAILMKWIYRDTCYFIANSMAVKQDYADYDGIPPEKISVIYNGVDLGRFNKIHRTSGRPSVVGIIANLNRQVKRIDVFLRAASYICKKRSDVSFLLVGEGELKSHLMSLATSLGIKNRVTFVGSTSNIEKYLSQIHIGVNTSETEGFANVILEYLASGIPVVATNTGGNREIIVDNKNGFLFPVNDYKALADILSLILDDDTLYSKLCGNVKGNLKERFDNSIMIRRYEAFFRKIVERKSQD